LPDPELVLYVPASAFIIAFSSYSIRKRGGCIRVDPDFLDLGTRWA
jgi:hypothetical protein